MAVAHYIPFRAIRAGPERSRGSQRVGRRTPIFVAQGEAPLLFAWFPVSLEQPGVGGRGTSNFPAIHFPGFPLRSAEGAGLFPEEHGLTTKCLSLSRLWFDPIAGFPVLPHVLLRRRRVNLSLQEAFGRGRFRLFGIHQTTRALLNLIGG